MTNFWWVNHKQTFQEEFEGGFIWSPKQNSNGYRNQTYVNLTLVKAGDIIISYADQQIKVIGIVLGPAISHAKPAFGTRVGENWDNEGWLVRVKWSQLGSIIRPMNFIDLIAPLLPERNSPLQENGRGLQGCYLASISSQLGELIISLTESDWVNELDFESSEHLDAEPVTEQIAQVRARKGQGEFRSNVLEIEQKCRVTQITALDLLIASHIKPWRTSDGYERLDGNNGLMLSPHVDKLFDKGWISFHDNGDLLHTTDAIAALRKWNIPENLNVGPFNSKQAEYLAFHRTHIFMGTIIHTYTT